MGLNNAEQQARWRERRAAEVEQLRKTATTAGLALVHAENDLLHRRVTNLEAELARERAAKAEAAPALQQLAEARATIDGLLLHIKKLELVIERLRKPPADAALISADSEVTRLKQQNRELQFKLRYLKDWYNDEIAKKGSLTFKAASLIAKALHPDATPSEAVRLEAFKAFSAWKSDSRDAGQRCR